MKKHKPTYDPRCYDLAELFLEDEKHLGTQARCERLAAGIQQYVEDFIASENADLLEEEAARKAEIRIEQRDEDRFYSKAAGRWIVPDWEPPDAA